MKTSKWDSLLEDLLSGEETAQCRVSSLQQTLAAVRGFQRRRRARRMAAFAALPMALAIACLVAHLPGPAQQRTSNMTLSPVTATTDTAVAAAGVAPTAVVRFISDDELLDLFPGRPVALIGSPGRQRFVFLDQR